MKNKNASGFFLLILGLIAILGAAAGAVYANSLDYASKREADNFLSEYYSTTTKPPKREMFADSFLKYGKTLAIIWITIFIPIGFIAAAAAIFLKGLSAGFTTAFLTGSFGFQGLERAFSSYFLQNLFLIPAYLLAALYVFYHAFSPRVKKFSPVSGTPYIAERGLFEYLAAAAIGIALIVLASFIDVLIV
jgi:stage II sporulation protein M